MKIKFLALILFVLLIGCTNQQFGGDSQIDEIPDNLKLEADKSKILDSKTVDWIVENPDKTITNKGEIKKYDYITENKIVDKTISFEADRGGFSNTEILSDVVNDGKREITVKKYNGDHYYKDETGDIYEIEHGATTTVEAFDLQTIETIIEKINKLFGKNAFAACGDSGGSCYAGSGDGYADTYTQATWALAQGNANANAGRVFTTGTMRAFSYNNTTSFTVQRSFMPVYTADLPDSLTVTAASVFIYSSSKIDDDNDGNDFITIVKSYQASPTTLAVSDFSLCGDAIDNPTEGVDSGNRKDVTGISTTGYTEFVLNSTGMSWINPLVGTNSGYTMFGFREGHDVLDNQPGTSYTGIYFYAEDQTGTSQDPYITITYTIGGGSPAPILDSSSVIFFD